MAACESQMHRFRLTGMAAIDPKALGLEFLLGAPTGPPTAADGAVALVHVCGPLAFAGFLFDTYSSVRERVKCALQSDAAAVVLVLDSPGGDVDGCFDCVRGMRADAIAMGKPLIAWVPAKACSAAYALATACSRIVCASSAQVGSVGVIHELQSVARQDAAAGVDFAFVVSGAKKALGNPHMPISDAAREEIQGRVDSMADLFFGLVREARPSLDPAPLQAGIFIGADAVRRGLADEVSTFDALVAQLAGTSAALGATQATIAPEQAATGALMALKAEDKKDDDKDKEDMRARLKRESASDDPVTAKRAARALKAYDTDEDDDKATAAKADEPAPPKEDDKKGDKAAVPSAAAPTDEKAVAAAGSLAATVAEQAQKISALQASLATRDKKDADAERAAFFAQHTDLPKPLLDSLAGLPLAQCRSIVAAVPAAFRSQAPELARPALQGIGGDLSDGPSGNEALNIRMGLAVPAAQVGFDGVHQYFGVAPDAPKAAASPKKGA